MHHTYEITIIEGNHVPTQTLRTGGGQAQFPLENIVASGAFAVARFQCSLFSPFSPSLPPPPAAVKLKALAG